MTLFSEITLKMFLCHGLHSDNTTRKEGAGGYQKGSSTGKQVIDIQMPIQTRENQAVCSSLP